MTVLSGERQYDVLAYGPSVSPGDAVVRDFLRSFSDRGEMRSAEA